VKQVLFVFASLCLCTSSAFAQNSCAQSLSSEKCFGFHGRFAVYTADGKQTLWPVGTRRILRVESGADPLLKFLGDDPVNANNYFIFGDFVVCPLEKEIPGAMRSVCIKSAQNLRRMKR
jgi:hypothetical protein